MPAAASFLARGASVGLIVLPPFLLGHWPADWSAPELVAGIAGLQAGAFAWLLVRRAGLAMCVFALVCGAVRWLDPAPRLVGEAMAGACHFAAYGALLVWFARSLLPGSLPAVTGFATRLRRSMPDKVVRYTRHVTFAWTMFFAAQLLASAALLLLAPVSAWYLFIGTLNLPLLAAMTLAEYACRKLLFRHEPRTGLFATLSALRRSGFAPGRRP